MSQIPVPSIGALNLAGSLGRTGQAQREVQQSGRDFSSLVQGQIPLSHAAESVEQTELSADRDADTFYFRHFSGEESEQGEQGNPSQGSLSETLEQYRTRRPGDPHGELGTRLDIEV